MILSIALIFFSLVILTIFIGFYLWWKKYGKEMFNLIKNMSKTPQFPLNNRDLMKELQNFGDFFKKK
jgi:hypothetical protein